MGGNRFVAPIAAMLGKYDGKHMVCTRILWRRIIANRSRWRLVLVSSPVRYRRWREANSKQFIFILVTTHNQWRSN